MVHYRPHQDTALYQGTSHICTFGSTGPVEFRKPSQNFVIGLMSKRQNDTSRLLVEHGFYTTKVDVVCFRPYDLV